MERVQGSGGGRMGDRVENETTDAGSSAQGNEIRLFEYRFDIINS
jgi:hypothetical protein